MAPARSHQDEGSDAPQSGTLSASPTAAATVADDSTTNGERRENETGNAEGQRGAGAGAGDIAQAYKDLTSRRGLGQLRLGHGKMQFATGLDGPEMAFAHAKLQFALFAPWAYEMAILSSPCLSVRRLAFVATRARRHGAEPRCHLIQHRHEHWAVYILDRCAKDIRWGEQAASALEANLAKLESRLDELLAGFETDELRNASSGGKGPADK
ncbi:predicted protein [Verticillium alfalfae VaMs.102]|uniref:Predicted protein n=1 Tax=Verticillium alfalfae (strain VaMs.102 / ATCC MYA-4576 / FGSC 10136) TaxID=526221 RepID=C9SHQ6_VERA1|nr:predicted protein [Verticillium alfalfae VaMs.102]EEY18479.1 predicted protein [Verticillium alfalfae VaMs.102]